MSLLLAAETWVAISFLIFVGILVYVGVPDLLIDALDKRARRVQAELDEARRLKEEAREAAQRISGQAAPGGEAKRPASSRARRRMPSASPPKPRPRWKSSSRRTKMAETKIAQAEAQAVADVRAAAAEAAVSAAEKSDQVGEGQGRRGPDRPGIGDVKAKLNSIHLRC